ncbi:hypothetical protein T439DRAFT_382248 [Meredithblackwellia eburnea MCA 4105]
MHQSTLTLLGSLAILVALQLASTTASAEILPLPLQHGHRQPRLIRRAKPTPGSSTVPVWLQKEEKLRKSIENLREIVARDQQEIAVAREARKKSRKASIREKLKVDIGKLKKEIVKDLEEISSQKRALGILKKVQHSKATSTSKANSTISASSAVLSSTPPSSSSSSLPSPSRSSASSSSSHVAALAAALTIPTGTPVVGVATHSSNSSSSFNKKGLGYNTVSFLNGFGDSISWGYDWASTGSGLPAGVEFVPMLWGRNIGNWATAAAVAIASGSTHLLGFNEPDLSSQSNINPSDAATLWKANMEPFASKAKLVSPAITNGGAPMGLAWLQSFLTACDGCHVDVIAAHWYSAASDTEYFKSYFTDLYAKTGKKIWITEFMGLGSASQQQTFLETVIPWLESTDFIERYAAFGAFAGTFVNSQGELTALGKTYKNTV